jgi:hypothetical protein
MNKNIETALQQGKIPFKVVRNEKTRYTVGASLENVQERYLGWECIECTLEEALPYLSESFSNH